MSPVSKLLLKLHKVNKMADDTDKTKRAQEIDKAIKEHDARKKDSAVDLGAERSGGSSEGVGLDKFLDALNVMGRKLDDAFARMDALEKHRDDTHRKRDDDRQRDDDRKRDDETEEEYETRMREGGKAKEVVADSSHRAEFADAQTRAERAYNAWNMRSNPPLAGERLRDYRIRLLRPMQKHSKQFSKSDLDLLPRDEAIFGATEAAIYMDSVAASSSPSSVPRGQLRMIVKRLPSGHTINEFIGEPQAWMDRFGANRRYVTRINTKWSGNPE
jgi:hypothetical protein